MESLRDLFNPQQLLDIKDAPLFMGVRHPTWFPLFRGQERRAIDVLVDKAVCQIHRQPNGSAWLHDLVPRLMDIAQINNASSALAEIRTYGGLMEAGFNVQPILRKDETTPDFVVDAGGEPITVEVFAKHQDGKQDALTTAIHTPGAPLPEGVERHTHEGQHVTVTTTIAELHPGGKPDPSKAADSVQANMISRVCGIKKNEEQIPDDRPALLVIDWANFGGPIVAEMLKAGQTAPIESGHHGLTCGSLWYGLYGWKDAPVFEELSYKLVRMQHDGRFRITGANKSKLSAVLMVFSESAVLLENPWANRRLPDLVRLTL